MMAYSSPSVLTTSLRPTKTELFTKKGSIIGNGPAKLLIKNTFITLSDSSVAVEAGRNRTESCDAIIYGPRSPRSTSDRCGPYALPPGLSPKQNVSSNDGSGTEHQAVENFAISNGNHKETSLRNDIWSGSTDDSISTCAVCVTESDGAIPHFDVCFSASASAENAIKTTKLITWNNETKVNMEPQNASAAAPTQNGNGKSIESLITTASLESAFESSIILSNTKGESKDKDKPSSEASDTQPQSEEVSAESTIPIMRTIDLSTLPDTSHQNTTIMLRNIPNKYTSAMLRKVVDENFSCLYDFFYLPIDFKNKCNVGYAFINFIHPYYAELFWKAFDKKKLSAFKSNKVCAVTWGRVQGLKANIDHYRNSAVMSVSTPQYKPLLFQDGVEVLWPASNKPVPELKPRYKKS